MHKTTSNKGQETTDNTVREGDVKLLEGIKNRIANDSQLKEILANYRAAECQDKHELGSLYNQRLDEIRNSSTSLPLIDGSLIAHHV